MSIAGLASCNTPAVSSSSEETSSSTSQSSIKSETRAECKVTFIIEGETVSGTWSNGQMSVPQREKAHKRFAGWATKSDSKEIVISVKETITLEEIEKLTKEDAITLYAVYADLATVVFHNATPATITLDSLLNNVADVTGDAKEGFKFIGWTNEVGGVDALISASTNVTYSVVSQYLNSNKQVDLYPVYKEVEAGMTVASYFSPDTLPEIRIATENGIAIDSSSLINPNEHKGMNGEIPVYNYVNSTISVSNGEAGTDLTNVAGQVKVRGNYTSTYAKKPIRIKFEKKQSMLGLNNNNKCKSWVLLAEWKDSSMLRNSLADFIGNSILESDGYYCSDFRFVKVYLNNSYNGIYVLAEQQQINQYRVNIPASENETDGVDTGYLLEYDGYYRSEPALQSFTVNYQGVNAQTTGFSIVNDIMNQAQHDYIAKVTQTVFNVVQDATRKSHANLTTSPYHTMDAQGNYVVDSTITSAEQAVARVVDIDSLVDMYILHEICEDSDIGWSSFYLSIDMSPTGNKKLTFQAPWDFDYALGNSTSNGAMKATMNTSKLVSEGKMTQSGRNYKLNSNASLTNADFTFTNKTSLYAKNSNNPWLSVCNTQGWFWNKVLDKWETASDSGVFVGASTMIDVMTTKYVTDFAENFTKWSASMGRKIDMNQPDFVAYFSNQRQAAEYLKIWFDNRIEGLTTALTAEAARY